MAAIATPPDEALRRIRGEYLEMPGLRLTMSQAQRLWDLDRRTCEALLDKLVSVHFLSRTRDGSFVRRSES
jgi:Fic family protein